MRRTEWGKRPGSETAHDVSGGIQSLGRGARMNEEQDSEEVDITGEKY